MASLQVRAASGRASIGPPSDAGPVEWLARHAEQHQLRVDARPVDRLDGWLRDPRGNLVHRSGRFFSVRGVRTTDQEDRQVSLGQPLLLQRDVGILGILRTTFDGVPHYLLQAKIEPGNPGQVQLSPTVQATRSNYSAAHRGTAVPYLDHFYPLPSGRVVIDSLQGEHGGVFYHKHNRNMVVEVSNTVPVLPGFRWLRLDEVAELLLLDHVVNMDSRSVLSLLPPPQDSGPSLYEDSEIHSWLTRQRAADLYVSDLVDLDDVGSTHQLGAPGRTDVRDGVLTWEGAPFRVLGVEVSGGGREVSSWHQPMVELRGERVESLTTATFRGQPHLLVRAVRHHGTAQGVDLGPTSSLVDGRPDPWALPRPVLAEHVRGATHGEEDGVVVRYDVRLSEEGGRFHQASASYRIVHHPHAPTREPGPDHRWVTPRQLRDLVEHGACVSVQTRSLLATLSTGAVTL